ncbi:MAG TPA: glycosyltransferase family 39 protein [Steroidobacteraceae bacterium]|nr:glycosyltransferase family 39 protein [Steroidobacteraceae bacterium]
MKEAVGGWRLTVGWPQRWLRAGSNDPRDVRIDVLWLLGLGLLLIGTGIGLRDPWPADEPRFALVARDMVATGDWLVPRVGGDVYADKPPLFFWLMALALTVTRSLRVAFLLPSLLAGVGSVLLVYDLGRRLWNRETGFVAALALLFTVQFTWQARQAQIDAVLCFWTTLSLYGLLRHLVLGPQWRWYAIGCAAAGLGVISKGVGFLPLLVFIPFVVLKARGWSVPLFGSKLRWWLGPLAFLLAVSLWLVPMLLAARGDPVLAAYRDEILFRQTIDRYAKAWHHHEPFWYFVIQVMPVLWLPLTVLIPWLVPRWRAALGNKDLRLALLLSWIGLVVLFFSLSAGKRGVYILPALPAFALACAPFLAELLARQRVQRLGFILGAFITFACAAGAIYTLVRADKRVELLALYELDVFLPLAAIAVVGLVLCAVVRPGRGVLLYCAVFATVLLVVSFLVNPAMNAARSGADFARVVEQRTRNIDELGIIAFKEQYLLQLHRPIVHFGHARWREADQEAADAAAWLQQRPGRALIVNERMHAACFAEAASEPLVEANRTRWFLVRGAPPPQCVGQGHAQRAMRYVPPASF